MCSENTQGREVKRNALLEELHSQETDKNKETNSNKTNNNKTKTQNKIKYQCTSPSTKPIYPKKTRSVPKKNV